MTFIKLKIYLEQKALFIKRVIIKIKVIIKTILLHQNQQNMLLLENINKIQILKLKIIIKIKIIILFIILLYITDAIAIINFLKLVNHIL